MRFHFLNGLLNITIDTYKTRIEKAMANLHANKCRIDKASPQTIRHLTNRQTALITQINAPSLSDLNITEVKTMLLNLVSHAAPDHL